MLKRVLVFTTPTILSLKNCQLVISVREMPDEKATVPIEDIGVVLIENQQVSATIPLLNALIDANVSVIICDNRGMPHAMLQNLDSNTMQGETLRDQMAAGEVLKKNLWRQIVEAKIRNQARLLDKLKKDGRILKPFYANVKSGDTDNREGIAARIYWTELFGSQFIRDRSQEGVNVLLNYGYTVLRTAVARALIISGLFPAIGIFHRNRSNAFPLADDVMEPYRPYVDEIVFGLWQRGMTELNKDVKAELIKLLYCDTVFSQATRPLSVGLSMTMASLVKCYAKEITTLAFPRVKRPN
ncbi:MAG: type II CRISPR-associated endonuclease Cas1 [Bacteroides sp.]|nr:type II CRISPR-associated endonuclease Cas1 [Bacteroides sp.]